MLECSKTKVYKMLKSFTRSLIKLLFVVILPVVGTYGFVMAIPHLSIASGVMLGSVVLGLYGNAICWTVFMDKTRMLPKVTHNFVPVFGFAIGLDYTIEEPETSWIVLLPFNTFEITIPLSKTEKYIRRYKK